MYTYILR